MKKIAIVYWPKKGNVSRAAEKLHKIIEEKSELFDLANFSSREFRNYDYFIFGSSTVGADAWHNATTDDKWMPFFQQMQQEGVNLVGKTVAMFGLGDQIVYPDNFVDGMAILKPEFEKLGAEIVGEQPVTDDYEHTGSAAENDGKFLGLALDEDNQDHLTDERALKWLKELEIFGY